MADFFTAGQAKLVTARGCRMQPHPAQPCDTLTGLYQYMWRFIYMRLHWDGVTVGGNVQDRLFKDPAIVQGRPMVLHSFGKISVVFEYMLDTGGLYTVHNIMHLSQKVVGPVW
jgi:hypothetical protein